MFDRSPTTPPPAGSALFHLLGTVPLAQALEMQQRLVDEAAERRDAHAVVLVCEHPPTLTLGRQASRLHLRGEEAWLRAGHEVRWLNRGGGAVVHAPGQLAVYSIVPLEPFGLTVGRYLDALQRTLDGIAADVRFTPPAAPDGSTTRRGWWGRTGQIAFVGVAVRNFVAYHGLHINVDPPAELVRRAAAVGSSIDGDAAPGEASTLAAELRRPVRMPLVRQSVVDRLSTALGCARYNIVSGRPVCGRATA